MSGKSSRESRKRATEEARKAQARRKRRVRLAADGIVHIESPVQRTYTLGEFFDEWGQPLGPDQAGPAKGHVTVIYNGKVFKGSPRDVPLTAHAQIQLEVGTPLVAPESISWAGTGL